MSSTRKLYSLSAVSTSRTDAAGGRITYMYIIIIIVIIIIIIIINLSASSS